MNLSWFHLHTSSIIQNSKNSRLWCGFSLSVFDRLLSPFPTPDDDCHPLETILWNCKKIILNFNSWITYRREITPFIFLVLYRFWTQDQVHIQSSLYISSSKEAKWSMTGYEAQSLLIGMSSDSRSFVGLRIKEGNGINETCLFSVAVLQDPLRVSTIICFKANHKSSRPMCTRRQPCKQVLFPLTSALPVTWCLNCFVRQNQQRQHSKMLCPLFQITAQHFIFLPFKRQ
jgi:hypothetical protein